MNLSVVISVYNGEKFLHECLSSVKGIASEIIVVDHGSTDKTTSIAKKFTKKVFQQKNNPQQIDLQKNFGFEKATGDWILSLDADEKVSPGLAREIQNVLESRPHAVGFLIPRKNIIFGKWIEHTGWYPDYRLILFQKGKGKFTKKHVHENIQVEGEVAQLTSPIIHEAYQSVYQFLHRGLTVYAPNEAEALAENGYTFSYVDAIRFPFQEFLSRFFAREGYKDGFHGFMLSLLMSCYHFAVFAYLWEMAKFPSEKSGKEVLSESLPQVAKDFEYWQKTADIREAKNPAKTLLKIKRKLGL